MTKSKNGKLFCALIVVLSLNGCFESSEEKARKELVNIINNYSSSPKINSIKSWLHRQESFVVAIASLRESYPTTNLVKKISTGEQKLFGYPASKFKDDLDIVKDRVHFFNGPDSFRELAESSIKLSESNYKFYLRLRLKYLSQLKKSAFIAEKSINDYGSFDASSYYSILRVCFEFNDEICTEKFRKDALGFYNDEYDGNAYTSSVYAYLGEGEKLREDVLSRSDLYFSGSVGYYSLSEVIKKLYDAGDKLHASEFTEVLLEELPKENEKIDNIQTSFLIGRALGYFYTYDDINKRIVPQIHFSNHTYLDLGIGIGRLAAGDNDASSKIFDKVLSNSPEAKRYMFWVISDLIRYNAKEYPARFFNEYAASISELRPYFPSKDLSYFIFAGEKINAYHETRKVVSRITRKYMTEDKYKDKDSNLLRAAYNLASVGGFEESAVYLKKYGVDRLKNIEIAIFYILIEKYIYLNNALPPSEFIEIMPVFNLYDSHIFWNVDSST